jgi:DNA primase large subunit
MTRMEYKHRASDLNPIFTDGVTLARFPMLYSSLEFLKSFFGYTILEDLISDLLSDKINDVILNRSLDRTILGFGSIENDVLQMAKLRLEYAFTHSREQKRRIFKELFSELYGNLMETYTYADYFFSFVLAKYIVARLPKPFLYAFAESESKLAKSFLRKFYLSKLETKEPDPRLLNSVVTILRLVGFQGVISLKNLNIEIPLPSNYNLAISVLDYLRYTYNLKFNEEWKLYNRLVRNGYVVLSNSEIARLFQERYRARIIETTSHIENSGFEEIEKIVNEILEKYGKRFLSKFSANEGASQASGKLEFNPEAFPPCIKAMYQRLLAGENLSHHERFNLAAFLLRIGLSVDEVLQIFAHSPDFNEKIARYQIEHIAGLRGSGKKYMPASCRTMKMLGLCRAPEDDELCKRVKNPLVYYRIKLKMLKKASQSKNADDNSASVQRS